MRRRKKIYVKTIVLNQATEKIPFGKSLRDFGLQSSIKNPI